MPSALRMTDIDPTIAVGFDPTSEIIAQAQALMDRGGPLLAAERRIARGDAEAAARALAVCGPTFLPPGYSYVLDQRAEPGLIALHTPEDGPWFFMEDAPDHLGPAVLALGIVFSMFLDAFPDHCGRVVAAGPTA